VIIRETGNLECLLVTAYRSSMQMMLRLDEFDMWQHQSAASTEIGSVTIGAAGQKDYSLTVILGSLHSEFIMPLVHYSS